MANLDESIGNLRTLIDRLQTAKGKTQEAVGVLNGAAGDLAQLETNATQVIGEFIAAIDHFSSALHDGESETSGQLDKVADEAHRTAAERLAEMGRHFEEDDFTSSVQVLRDDLEKDAAGAIANGFQVMLNSIEHVRGEVDAVRSSAEAAFQTFDASVQGIRGDSEHAFAAGADAMEGSLTDFGDESTALEGHGSHCEAELHGRAADVQSECSASKDAGTAAYESHVASIDSAGQDLILSVHTLVEDSAGYVTSLSVDHIEPPTGMVIADAIPPLLDELAHLDEMVHDADHTTSDTETLCTELDRCQAVVAQIDQILDAMQEG